MNINTVQALSAFTGSPRMNGNSRFGRMPLGVENEWENYFDSAYEPADTYTMPSWHQPAAAAKPVNKSQSAFNALVYATLAAGLMMLGLVKYVK